MRDERLIRIHASSSRPFAERPFEACEHKGIGHPDTLTDGARPRPSLPGDVRAGVALQPGQGLLVAGRSAPRFGGGAIPGSARSK